ncbi:MAG TPA: substrate-binding domain-containing protein [Bryobacteraceae bacterium]
MRSLPALAALTVLFLQTGAAQAPLRVLASNGVREVVESLQPQCERAVGRPLAMQYGSSSALLQTIAKDDRFDVAILTSEALGQLVKDAKVVASSRVTIARAGIGVGVRRGAPKPDIRTPDALKQTLLKAKSIAYAQDGASRVYLEKMFDRLGIGKDLKPKIILEQGSGAAGARVANGNAELIMTLISEILPMQGVDFAGPLPAQLQSYVSFEAGLSTKAAGAEAGKMLLKFLAGPAAAQALTPKGMEPR